MLIKWHKNMQRAEWNRLLGRCPHTSLLQSYSYAQTMREVHNQGVRHGIINIDGNDVGLVQMQEVSLFNQLIHILSIDRGPLWFDGVDCTTEMMLEFARLLDKKFPRRFGRKRRFMPEFMQDTDMNLGGKWVFNSKIKQYKTYILDISCELDEIRQNLKKKWRNILNKSEKSDLKCVFDEKLDGLSGFFAILYEGSFAKTIYGGFGQIFGHLV